MSIMDISLTGSAFQFEGSEIRTLAKDGQPWFFATDVCRVLGVKNPSDALTALDADEKMTLDNTEGHSGQKGGAQSFNIINESGLYALVLKSRKPNAKAFRKWITSEVIPAIRKTGTYAAKAAVPAPSVPTTLKDALKLALHTMEERDVLAAQVEKEKPMVAFYHKVAATDDTLSLNETAKILGIGRNKMMIQMRGDGILTAKNLPYQRYLDAKLFEVALKSIDRSADDKMLVKMTRVLPRGLEFLRRKYAVGQLNLLP